MPGIEPPKQHAIEVPQTVRSVTPSAAGQTIAAAPPTEPTADPAFAEAVWAAFDPRDRAAPADGMATKATSRRPAATTMPRATRTRVLLTTTTSASVLLRFGGWTVAGKPEVP